MMMRISLKGYPIGTMEQIREVEDVKAQKVTSMVALVIW
jgi:hypothetical protein